MFLTVGELKLMIKDIEDNINIEVMEYGETHALLKPEHGIDSVKVETDEEGFSTIIIGELA